MSLIGMGADQEIINNLFIIFDYNQRGTICYKELLCGLLALKDVSFEEKISIYLEMCETNFYGKISQKEVYNVFK